MKTHYDITPLLPLLMARDQAAHEAALALARALYRLALERLRGEQAQEWDFNL